MLASMPASKYLKKSARLFTDLFKELLWKKDPFFSRTLSQAGRQLAMATWHSEDAASASQVRETLKGLPVGICNKP